MLAQGGELMVGQHSAMQSYEGLTLMIPEKPDAERDAVAACWSEHGGSAIRLGRFWEPPEIAPERVRVYGNDTFCLVVAEKLGLSLTSPPDDLIAHVPPQWLGREVSLLPLHQALASRFPSFFKPVVPKQFRAQVYDSREELENETRGLDGSERVVRSSIVRFQAEARAFILNGRVLDVAVYEGKAPAPRSFMEELSSQIPVPSACVLDVGLLERKGWVFLEANAAWGAGLNGCDAARVLPCIERASHTAQSRPAPHRAWP